MDEDISSLYIYIYIQCVCVCGDTSTGKSVLVVECTDEGKHDQVHYAIQKA